ncbi:MAG: [Fe-Fe] hydrogenase large subunit C-terminal domain-containing protein [Anaeromassilibacillus sp.]
MLEKVKSGEATYHFIEIMGCPGGCINGGGQPHSLATYATASISAVCAPRSSATLTKTT